MAETATGATPGSDATSEQAGQDKTQRVETVTATETVEIGDAGRRAIEAERQTAREALARTKALEKELETLRAATQTDQEKAIAQARKEATAEVLDKADQKVRSAETKRALQAAGCTDVPLAALAREFAGLRVTDEGDVTDLDKTVDAFKKAHPALFGRVSSGSADGGARGSVDVPPTMNELMRAAARG